MGRKQARALLICIGIGITSSFLAGLSPPTARAKTFAVGEVDGLIDITLAYGLLARTQERDPDFIGLANGGNLPSVDTDDGTLNYDTGLVTNELRLSGDLTLSWRNFGLFVRGYGFYDFETELGGTARTQLSNDARKLVGAGGKLQEYYLSANFAPAGFPLLLRVGDQIINWGEGGFLRFGTDVINPIDFVEVLRPTASARDIFIPQGMIWAASNVSENIAIEAFYQYRWEPVVDSPVGWFFSADDLLGGDGVNYAVTGAGEFSDLGTDLDARYGSGGFDETFMRIPSDGRIEPRNHGQYGFTVQALIPRFNAMVARLHFISYHSRLPLISGRTANQDAIEEAAAASGESEEEQEKTLGELSKDTRYFVTYPEDIRMLGASFNVATTWTGTLIAGELSHHFNWPVQVLETEVLANALSPITDPLRALDIEFVGKYGANEVVTGIDEAHKTQLALDFVQVFGPRWWSSQSALSVDVGWVHFSGLSEDSVFDEDSWGYTISGAVTYEGVFGGISVEPFVGFTHDVSGVTPGPAGAFLEDRKSVTVGVGLNFTNTLTSSLSYVNFFDGKPLNAGVDRDFLTFNLKFYY